MIRFVTGQVAKGRSLAELARATGRNRTLLNRYQGLAKAHDYAAALFADISMRSAVAFHQARKSLVKGKRVSVRVDLGWTRRHKNNRERSKNRNRVKMTKHIN